jgi:hypothetical protein
MTAPKSRWFAFTLRTLMPDMQQPLRITLRGVLFAIAWSAICVRLSMVASEKLDLWHASLLWAGRFVSFFGALTALFGKTKIGILIGIGVFLCWLALSLYILGSMRR